MTTDDSHSPQDTWTIEFPSLEDMTPEESAGVLAGGPWPIRTVSLPTTPEGKRRHALVLNRCLSWTPPVEMIRGMIHALADLIVGDLKNSSGGAP